MVDIALKNLGARKARSALCVIAVMVCVYLNGSAAAMNNWMYQTMTSELARYMGKIYVQQGESGYPPFDSAIQQEAAEAILARDDLGVNPRESAALLFVRTRRAMMPFMPADAMVIGVPPGKENVLMGDLAAAEGANRLSDSSDAVILGEQAARFYEAASGQDIAINGHALHVVGVLKRSSMDSVNISAIVTLAAAQEIFGKEGMVSAVLLTAEDVTRTAGIAEALARDYPVLGVNTQGDMLEEANEVLRMPIFYMSMMSMTAFIVLVAVIMSTMVMAVMERRREIGTLRAIGSSRTRIVVTILLEILFLSLIGGIPGALLSLPMASVMQTSLPSAGKLAQIVLFAVMAGLLGGSYPAIRAARVVPLEALRYE
jgi:putative ABC transport system permease protein